MKQILYEIKSQPVIAAVTIIGTALAMFLIMVVVMMQQVKLVDMAPESDRGSYLYVSGLDFVQGESSGNYCLSAATARELGENIDGIEATGISQNSTNTKEFSIPGTPGIYGDVRETDDGFFRVYDFTILAGTNYDAAAVESHLNQVVVTETIARQLHGSVADAVGKEILIEQEPFTIVGVIKDVSPVTNKAYSQAYIPLREEDATDFWTSMGLGQNQLVLKLESGAEKSSVIDEVNRRVGIINTRAEATTGTKIDIQGAPYSQEEELYHSGNVRPNISKVHRDQIFLFAILLIVPAINLSSMTRSRLRRRVSEIGVRRAFGCHRSKVIIDILTENFIITIVGGLIGLVLTIIFGSLLYNLVFTTGWFENYSAKATVSVKSLLDWSMFAYALLFCFILNLLSAGIPAWRASRINPVEAINSSVK